TKDISIEVINKAISEVEAVLKFPLNEKQKKAFSSIPHKKLNILTGLGGPGKSYTTRAVLDVIDLLGETYTMLAPTGTAVKVLTNSTDREAMTIHRRFYAGDEDITTDWLIIDECSMLSLSHFILILEMLKGKPTKLLLIGDINQLIPIDAGSPFRDIISLIDSKMLDGNVIHLTEIMRSKSDSAISHVCKMFTEYGSFDPSVLKEELNGVKFIPIDKDNFTGQISSVIENNNFDLKETFVLSPFNVREFGTGVINEHVQNRFNDNEIGFTDGFNKKYKYLDYLMHIKNNTKLGIYNGERIQFNRIEQGEYGEDIYVCTKVDENQVIRYDYDTFNGQTMLAYSISVHKSQGASLKNTVVVIDSSHIFALSKNTVYTAMSRASKNLVVLYDYKAIMMASKKNETIKRKTFLREIFEMKLKKGKGNK
ncbi:MAG: ATP-dependent DNA helicase, partial [Cetobacterium somerae]